MCALVLIIIMNICIYIEAARVKFKLMIGFLRNYDFRLIRLTKISELITSLILLSDYCIMGFTMHLPTYMYTNEISTMYTEILTIL